VVLPEAAMAKGVSGADGGIGRALTELTSTKGTE
jgi:hypothetical protein